MSGFFVYVSSLLSSIIGDASQNNWFGGAPRAPITYPNGPTSPPERGNLLVGEALTAADQLMQYHKARIYWMGNEQLAAKYGTTTPLELTVVEQEMWAREIAVLQYSIDRITEILSGPPPFRKEPKQESAAEKKQDPVPEKSLVDKFKDSSPAERAELLKVLLAVGSQP